MKSSTMRKTATLTALTVLTGAVAVTPLHAAETVVKSGSTASISASGGTTVDPVKVQSFIKNVIKGNYEKNANVWLGVDVNKKGVLGSIYKFNADTGTTEKAVDVAGHVVVESQFNGGALVSVHGMLVNDFAINNNFGSAIVSGGLMVIANSGECLDLEFIVKYSPWYPVLSQDGSTLAFLGHEGNGSGRINGLYVLDFRTMAVKQIFTGDLKTAPAWSSDSSKILISKDEGYTAKHKIVVIDAGSGRVADTGYNGCNAVFSDDGKRIAYAGEFVQSGRWIRGVPASGNIFIADYPDGKPVKLTFLKNGGAIMPRFSPDGKRLAYFNATDNTTYELHVIDLNTNDDRLICSIPKKGKFVEISKWTDNAGLMLIISDFSSANTLVKQIDMTNSTATIKDIEPIIKIDSDSVKAVMELESVLKLYLAGLQSSGLNRRDESRNYKEAYTALLKFNDSARNIDPALKLESLAPYLKEFKKLADMPERELYLKELKERLEALSFMINSYVAKNKRLPDSMEEYAKFIITCNFNSIRANSPEAKCMMRMPDEQRDVVTSFELKKIDGNNLEIWSAPLPWGGKLKVRLELKNGHWAPKGEAETVSAP